MSHRAETSKHRAIFTLVELLVVFSVIIVLTGLLLPSLSKTREITRGIYCINNLKQYGASLTMYSDVYNGMLIDVKTNSVANWFLNLTDHGLQTASFKCPSVKEYLPYTTSIFDVPSKVAVTDSWNTAPGSCYGINADNYLGVGTGTHPSNWSALKADYPGAPQNIKISMFRAPSTTIWCLEYHVCIYGRASSSTDDFFRPQAIAHSLRHTGKMNIVYCDGHASSQLLTDIKMNMFTIEND
jgi:prepilin-type processing-associated H-X9-DG protein